jgi:hypothetical protein
MKRNAAAVLVEALITVMRPDSGGHEERQYSTTSQRTAADQGRPEGRCASIQFGFNFAESES